MNHHFERWRTLWLNTWIIILLQPWLNTKSTRISRAQTLSAKRQLSFNDLFSNGICRHRDLVDSCYSNIWVLPLVFERWRVVNHTAKITLHAFLLSMRFFKVIAKYLYRRVFWSYNSRCFSSSIFLGCRNLKPYFMTLPLFFGSMRCHTFLKLLELSIHLHVRVVQALPHAHVILLLFIRGQYQVWGLIFWHFILFKRGIRLLSINIKTPILRIMSTH